jgi:hypothetical protein
MYCLVETCVAALQTSPQESVSASRVAKSLILLAVSGLPFRDHDFLPGCGSLTVLDCKRRGLIFTQPLQSVYNQGLLNNWLPTEEHSDLEVISMPPVFIKALASVETYRRQNPALDAAFDIFRHVSFVQLACTEHSIYVYVVTSFVFVVADHTCANTCSLIDCCHLH